MDDGGGGVAATSIKAQYDFMKLILLSTVDE